MFRSKRLSALAIMLGLTVVLSLILSACATPTAQVIKETVVVKEEVEKVVKETVVVEKQVEKVAQNLADSVKKAFS